MTEGRESTKGLDRRTIAALEPFFAAARAEVDAPPLALFSAILADAGRVSAERSAHAPEPTGGDAPPAERRGRFELVGGWRGLASLAACAVLGFWIGIAGNVTIEDGKVWAGSSTASADALVADSGTGDPVDAFFDLAATER